MNMHFPISARKIDMQPLMTRPVQVCMHVIRDIRDDVRLQRAAKTLATTGCAVTVLDVVSNGNSSELPTNKQGNQHYHIKHIFAPTNFNSQRFEQGANLKALRLFVSSLYALLKQPTDIYHACELTALPTCYCAAMLRRKPLIFEAYELPLQDQPLHHMRKSRKLFYACMQVFLKHALSHCAAIITVSPPIVRELQQKYRIHQVILLRNLPCYRSTPKTNTLRAQLGLSARIQIALYQGNLQPDRGLDRLVRAAAYLEPEHVIVLMGKNIGTTQAELEQLISLQGVKQSIRIIPAVPYEDLLTWTASADLGLTIIPLDYTRNMKMSLPNKLFEYIQAGLPVLSSPQEAMRDILETYDVGNIVRSMDPADVGTAINTMLGDPVMLAHMRDNALRAAREVLYWEKESLKLIQLYKNILHV